MSDSEQLIESSFDRILPRPVVTYAWEDVCERAGITRGHARWPRRRWALVVVLVAFIVVAGAVAAAKDLPWWQSGAPPVDPQAVVSVARDNMPANVRVAEARTVATSGNAALVAVPMKQTGYCLIPTLDGRAQFGASCVYSVKHPASGAGDTLRGVTRPPQQGRDGVWLVFGRLVEPRAASIDAHAFSVKLSTGGFFITQIPRDQWAALNRHAAEAQLKDASGKKLRRGCVSWGDSPLAAASTVRTATTFGWMTGTRTCEPVVAPAPPTFDFHAATHLMDVRLTHSYSIWKPGQTVAFYEAPASSNTTCVLATGPGMTLDQLAARPAPSLCPGRGPTRAGEALHPGISAQLSHETGKPTYVWAINGSYDPARVATVKVATPSGQVTASTADGFFFVQLPEMTPGPSPSPSFPAGRFTLIGYDREGNDVAHVNVGRLHWLSSPH